MIKIHRFLKSYLGHLFWVVLIIFLISCPKDTDITKSSGQSISAHSLKASDFAEGQLEAHYLKHKDEFGDITQEEYLNNARMLLNSSPSQDILEKIRPNGDILHYRVSTGEFAVMTKDGRIRTYFKTNYRYWLKQ